MRKRAASAAIRLAKLAFAFAVLALGTMLSRPAETAGWPLAGMIAGLGARLASVGAVGREPWAVVTLLFGLACLLAALPKSVQARARPAQPLPLVVADHVEEIQSLPIAMLHASPPPELIPMAG